MYEPFFGLDSSPFGLTPDPRFLFRSRVHHEILSLLLYGVTTGKGVMVLLGDVGTGKTTLCRALLRELPAEAESVLVLNPHLSETELVGAILDDLGLERRGSTRGELMTVLSQHLLAAGGEGKTVVVVVDEAQQMSVPEAPADRPGRPARARGQARAARPAPAQPARRHPQSPASPFRTGDVPLRRASSAGRGARGEPPVHVGRHSPGPPLQPWRAASHQSRLRPRAEHRVRRPQEKRRCRHRESRHLQRRGAPSGTLGAESRRRRRGRSRDRYDPRAAVDMAFGLVRPARLEQRARRGDATGSAHAGSHAPAKQRT